jgi:hypothetical protein
MFFEYDFQIELVVDMFGEDIPDNFEGAVLTIEEKVIQETTPLILSNVEEIPSVDESMEELVDTCNTYPLLENWLAKKEERRKVIQETTLLIPSTVEEQASVDESVEELVDSWNSNPFLGNWLAIPNKMPI